MGWLFKYGYTRRQMIAERTTNWERSTDKMRVISNCLAHCYRGCAFSGVLWSVWERNSFTNDGQLAQATERWIACDLLQYRRYLGWGYKDQEESMGPYQLSCPLSYLEIVPIAKYGGNAGWRERVKAHHELRRAKRRSTGSSDTCAGEGSKSCKP